MELTINQLESFGLDKKTAQNLAQQANQCLQTATDVACWQLMINEFNKHQYSFDLQLFLYNFIYQQRDPVTNPGPAWIPNENDIQNTHIATALAELNLTDYAALHKWSIENRQQFWQYALKKLAIVFSKSPDDTVDLSQGVEQPQWLPGAELNIVDSCFQTDKNSIAIIAQDEQRLIKITYGELEKLVNRIANSIVDNGYQAGAALAIDMPMNVNAVAIYLAIIKAGCVVVSIADSFAANEIATRLDISKAQAIFTQDVIKRNHKSFTLHEKVKEATEVPAIVLITDLTQTNNLRPQDKSWENFLGNNESFKSVPCLAEQSCNILFSSGTTAEPKAIPWTHATAIKAATDAYFHHDIQATDIFSWPTNLGWMMGPWLVFATLINRATMALSDEVPTSREFGRFIEQAKVTLLGLVPSLVKTWRATKCMENLNWQNIKAYSSSGECSNSEDMLYLMSLSAYKPIIEYCGGTEIGGGYITSTLVQENIPATFSTPALGLDFLLLDEEGNDSSNGEVALLPPSMGLSNRLLNKDHYQVYFADMPTSAAGAVLRRHGDQLERLNKNYYRALGRADDTMNLGGTKISSVEIERVLAEHNEIIETAAVGINPRGGGPSQLVIFAVVAATNKLSTEQLKQHLQQLIKTNLNPLFKIQQVVIVESLPRTASNKVMRRVLRDNLVR